VPCGVLAPTVGLVMLDADSLILTNCSRTFKSRATTLWYTTDFSNNIWSIR